MSTLTKEVLNIRIKWGKHPDRNLPPKDIYALFAHIDRLSARVEELEKESKDYFRIIEERGVQITELCDKLTTLIEAADMIVDNQEFINNRVREADIEMLFENLNKAVKEAKGE